MFNRKPKHVPIATMAEVTRFEVIRIPKAGRFLSGKDTVGVKVFYKGGETGWLDFPLDGATSLAGALTDKALSILETDDQAQVPPRWDVFAEQ